MKEDRYLCEVTPPKYSRRHSQTFFGPLSSTASLCHRDRYDSDLFDSLSSLSPSLFDTPSPDDNPQRSENKLRRSRDVCLRIPLKTSTFVQLNLVLFTQRVSASERSPRCNANRDELQASFSVLGILMLHSVNFRNSRNLKRWFYFRRGISCFKKQRS